MGAIKNAPEMNITNQINAGLNDVRSTLIEFSTEHDPHGKAKLANKANYQLSIIMMMIGQHRDEQKSIPWSEMKGMVEEEFSGWFDRIDDEVVVTNRDMPGLPDHLHHYTIGGICIKCGAPKEEG